MCPVTEPRRGPGREWLLCTGRRASGFTITPRPEWQEQTMRSCAKRSLAMSRRQLLVAGCCAASTMSLGVNAQPALAKRKIDIVMTQGLSGLIIHEIAK